MRELVAIEMTRLFGDPSILRAVPGLGAALELGGVMRILAQNPWDVDCRALLSQYKTAVSARLLEQVQLLIDDRGYKDVVLDMIQYRQRTPTNSKERIAEIATSVCRELGIRETYEDQVAASYARVYADIIRT
jgi:hypothetical protein